MNCIRDFRPKLHFTPPAGWINDPNGLVYENGNYHLFYQYYPHSVKRGPMHWGHSVSKDLISWNHLPVALAPDELGDIYSGSAVYDENNTSGLFPETGKGIVAVFTHNGESQQQSIAYSSDGVNFTKYKGNPVIKNPGIRSFRDPKVFRNPIKDCWSMIMTAGDRVHFYSSDNLIDWEKTGEFGPEGNHSPGIWECPDLFPLYAPNGEEVWVLITSMMLPNTVGGPKAQYFLGTFNGDTFICDRPFNNVEWIDPGFDNYASVTYYGNIGIKDKVIIGWGSNWVYAKDTPTEDYCGMMTLARKISLVDTPKGIRLSSVPYNLKKDLAESSVKLENSCNKLDSEVFGLQIEGEGAFSVTLSNDTEEMVFGVNENNEVFLDRGNAGIDDFNEFFATDFYKTVTKKRLFDGKIKMQAIFDVSMLEVFCDNGTFACSSLLYPKKPYTKITYTGNITVNYNKINY